MEEIEMTHTYDIQQVIQRRIQQVEEEHGVRVLYAVESGSRAWGFASPDSDYDVRLIYARPVQDYIRIQPIPDTLTSPLDEYQIDLHGWDLSKASGLLRKSNNAIMEWLYSPIVYREVSPIIESWRELVQQYGSRKRLAFHHMSLIQQHLIRFIYGHEEVSLKKYFYLFRSLLSIRWIEEHQTIPPIQIHELLAGVQIDNLIQTKLQEYLALKKNVLEVEKIPNDPTVVEWFEQEKSRLEQLIPTWEEIDVPLDMIHQLLWRELGVL